MRPRVHRDSTPAWRGWWLVFVLLVLAGCSDATGPRRGGADERTGGGTAESHGGPRPHHDIGILDLGLPAGATSGQALAINDAGTVVGTYGGPGLGTRFFRWTVCTGLVDLGDIGAAFGAERVEFGDFNNRGDIVGTFIFPGGSFGSARRAFVRLASGEVRLLQSFPGAPELGSTAYGINDAGVVVGLAPRTEGGVVAVRWDENGVPLALPGSGAVAKAINDRGEIVGEYPMEGGLGSVIYWPTPDQFITFGMSPREMFGFIRVNDINDATPAQFVGQNSAASIGTAKAYLWTSARESRLLGALGSAGNISVALAINDRGWVVGESDVGFDPRSGTYPRHAFLWTEAAGSMDDLGTLGGASSAALDVNASGVIVGTAQAADGSFRPVLWIARPRPGFGAAVAASLEEPLGPCSR